MISKSNYTVMLVIMALASAFSAVAQSSASDKPNIIFILTDDQRWDAIGYAGNDIIQTPHMDALAEEGVFFRNAFVTTPICAASRASLLCGQYERSHGYTFKTPPLKKKLTRKSYPQQLREAGYYTGMIGKVGVNFEKKQALKMFNVYEDIKQNFYYRLAGPGSSKHIHLTDHIGQRVDSFLLQRPSDKPFCLSISFHAPHAADASPEQYIWPERFDDMYEDIEIPAPSFADSHYFDSQPAYVREGLNRLRWLWRYDTPEKYQHSVKGYYRMISAVDDNIGKIRETLEELGVADNTIIILMGDNGYFLGERGFAGKWLMYEPSLRVPLIIYDPIDRPQSEDREEMALNIDVPMTILDYANIDPPSTMQGESLRKLLKSESREWRSSFLCEHLFDHEFIPQSEGIRTDTWKYFRYRGDPAHEELYNLADDPWEDHDLSQDEQYADQLKTLRQKTDAMISDYERR